MHTLNNTLHTTLHAVQIWANTAMTAAGRLRRLCNIYRGPGRSMHDNSAM